MQSSNFGSVLPAPARTCFAPCSADNAAENVSDTPRRKNAISDHVFDPCNGTPLTSTYMTAVPGDVWPLDMVDMNLPHGVQRFRHVRTVCVLCLTSFEIPIFLLRVQMLGAVFSGYIYNIYSLTPVVLKLSLFRASFELVLELGLDKVGNALHSWDSECVGHSIAQVRNVYNWGACHGFVCKVY